ncbi:hypothetical protein JB92DRAFT_2828845 [Gautieria morchelliformis]|nr:hypothetical protein JB92DRAFT_2828845 [Gautieria morchelliformis]
MVKGAEIRELKISAQCTVRSGDGCTSIESQFALTNAQFDGLNPGLSSDCTNLILGVAYCVFPISPFSTPPSNSSAPPSNVALGTITNGSCTDYYTIVSGDNCGAIESKFNIMSVAFSAWTPEIVADCSNLQLGLAYCVTGPMISGGSGGPPPNLANGMLANCTTYHTVVSGGNCPAIETTYSIAAADFFRWNPEVSMNCVNILVGEAYCIGGGTSPCAKIYTVKSGDLCFAVTQAQNIT